MPSLTSKLKALNSVQDTIPKLIDDDSVPDQKLDEYYVKLNGRINDGGASRVGHIEIDRLFSSDTCKAFHW